ncbi:MAG: ras guanine nucleotide exchange factor domain-containing protein [Linnemannia gamsii]|nr:MAG: ras guanine nucleotide exchange factor domain-containing protein [Linnemannia gamsii]
MVSETLDIQVLVRAMYDYESEDATNLTFKKDDVIQVLAQLDSGWWAGHCQGRQGWFPSNYVQVLGDDDLEDDDSQDGEDPEHEGEDLDYQQQQQQQKSGVEEQRGKMFLKRGTTLKMSADDLWLPQTTPDGQVFYYNQRTQESSWTIPEPEDRASMGNADTAGQTGWSVRESTSNGNGWYNSEAEDDDQDQDQDQENDERTQGGARLSRASSTHSSANNKVTNNTIASVGDAASTTGSSTDPAQTLATVRKPSGLATGTPQDSVEGLPPLPLLPNPFDPEPTWDSLSEHTAAAVENLLSSAEKGYKPYYLIQSSIVVEAIRVMLYASGTVDKDAAIMRQHRGLKMHHRQIMAALSKLVLSAKMASGVWPAADSVDKLMADAKEVRTAAQNYVTTAIAAEITVHQVDARLVTDVKSPLRAKVAARTLDRALSNGSLRSDHGSATGERKTFGSQLSTQSILSQLDYYAKSASKAVTVLAMQIEKAIENPAPALRNSGMAGGSSNPVMNSAQSAQLVTQARQTISQLGSLLTLVTDFYTSTQQEHPAIQEKYFADVRTAKQSLHGGTASMVMAIQSATDLLAVGQTLDLALNTALATEKAAQSLVVAARALIQEKEMADASAPMARAPYDPYGRKPSMAAYSGRGTQGGFPFPTSPSEGGFGGVANSATPGRYDIRGEKVKKMLGDDVPGRGGTQYWFLNYDYQQTDLVLNAEGQVKGGTLPALIERLTLHDGLDSNFIATFLLTYRSFTSTKELFTYLFHRFTIHPPMGLDPEELEIWTEKKLTPIRLRVFNIIKSWLETYYLEDESDDHEALAMIKDFSGSAAMKDTMSFAAVQLIKLVEKREQSEGAFRKMVLNLTTQAPPPITPRNLKKIKFLELDPLEFARQLTIMEANAYNKIKPVECLAKAWTSEDPEIAAKAVNIKKMIETSNLYSNWINELVLSEKELKKRVLVIRHLVMIAEKLRQLNNFSMLSATMAALSQSPIHRLKRTWEQVPSRTMTAFMDLQALMGVAKNWAEYREELHSVNPPCVPFVGMYLTDLVMIQDGNGDFLKKSNHLINFYKRVKTAEVIREIQQYQSVPYCLTSVPEIQSFIRRGQDCTKSVADLYEMSLQLEPRTERGDEKIARLLGESGML